MNGLQIVAAGGAALFGVGLLIILLTHNPAVLSWVARGRRPATRADVFIASASATVLIIVSVTIYSAWRAA